MGEKKSYLEQNWDYLVQFFPVGWAEQAKKLGAFFYGKKIPNPERLLRVLLIHLIDGVSLRETAVRADLGGIVSVSDVALLKRLRNASEWFRWMAHQLASKWLPHYPQPLALQGFRLRIVDATVVNEPGATGSDWRIHYSVDPFSFLCQEFLVTDNKVGESLFNFEVRPGDVFLLDRGYFHPKAIESVSEKGGYVVVRMVSGRPLYNHRGKPWHLIKKLRRLKKNQVADWPVFLEGKNGLVEGRVCATRKTPAAAKAARKKVLLQAQKKGNIVKQETLECAGYIFVFTTLPKDMVDATTVLELYRCRWQVELVFKRMKSLLQLGHLPKQSKEVARAWLHGKLFSAFLVEVLVNYGLSFSPWGHPNFQESEGKKTVMKPKVVCQH